MRHGPDRGQVIFHGIIDIARAGETSRPRQPLPTILHRPYRRLLRLRRPPAPCAEITEHAPRLYQPSRLVNRTTRVIPIIKRLILTCHNVIKLGYDSQHLDLQQYRRAPVPLEADREMPLLILLHSHKPAVIPETLKETVEPIGDVPATPSHEANLLIGDSHLLQHRHLLPHKLCETRRIDRVVAVNKHISDHRPREVLDHGATHREFVKVVIREFRYYLAHNPVAKKSM